MAYGKKVLDHYENPRNVGVLDKDAANVGTGMVGAPACGDVMRLQIQVNDDGVIEEAKFKTYGCGSAIASSSLLTEWVKGKTLDEALKDVKAEFLIVGFYSDWLYPQERGKEIQIAAMNNNIKSSF